MPSLVDVRLAPAPVPETSRALWSNSRELGLALAVLGAKYLLNTTHLHYGYWEKDVPVKLSNLATAQQRLSDFIVGHIPPGVKSILDVGCGAGALADQLLSAGYSVDCVCPNPVLVRHARRLLKNRANVYECKFEAFETDGRYDLVLFSESFQYAKTHKSLTKAAYSLKRGGYVLICDFFSTDAPGECVIGGGPNLANFYELISHYPYKKLQDIDITAQTAPTLDLLGNMLARVTPFWHAMRRLGTRSSVFERVAGVEFAAKLDKLERKYFSGLRTGQHFSTFKSYRLLLYQKLRQRIHNAADCTTEHKPG